MNRINVMQPWLGADEIAAVTAVIESGWVAQGPNVAEFESAFAARMGVPDAVAVSSCTTALHLSLVVAGIGVSPRTAYRLQWRARGPALAPSQ